MSGKRLWFVPVLLLLVLLLGGGAAFGAGTATLLRDINPAGVDPYDESGVAGNPLSLGRVALLPVREMSSGRELWVSDGTDAGTRPLLDLCPGECSSDITLLGRVGTTGLLLMGTYLDREPVLWRSDGTPGGTFPLFAETAPRLCASREMVAAGSAFFFTAEVGDGCGLWKTDGTREGTVALRQFTEDTFDGLSRLTAVGDRLYFVVGLWGGTHPEITLWRTDGTADGTLQLAVWTSSNPVSDLVAAGSRLFFVAPMQVANGGYELWSSDGTPAGTRPVTGFLALDPFVPRFEHPGNGRVLQAVDNQLCFLADDDAARELWCSDGTPAGTRRVTEFTVASPFVDLERWRVEKLGQRLVFPANNGTNGTRLWTTTGQPASTAQIASSPELAQQSATLIRSGARVYFLGNREGNQLWTSDGTNAGTRQVHRVCAGDCEITSPTPLLGRLFFGASDLAGSTSLWLTDGSEAGTRRVAEIGSVYNDEGLIPFRAAQVEDRGLLPMEDGNSLSGVSLWATDGTPEGTARVTRIGGNGESSSPRQLVPAGAGIRFLISGNGGEQLWSSLGTEESTVPAATNLFLERLVSLGDLTLGYGYLALWRTDGTPEGTYRLVTEEEGDVTDAVALPSRVVFIKRQLEPPYELWSTDGTLAGTHRIFDLPSAFSFLHGLTARGGRAYFVTTRSNHEDQLWETDGTEAGTRRITTQEHLFIESPLLLARVGSTLYFLGDDDQLGKEVWRADGTPDGTRAIAEGVLTDIADLGAFQGSLYIVAARNEFPYSYGLWKSDGTDAGTVRVAELPRPDTTSGLPAQFTPVGSLLYFVVERELWRTDGTAQGTIPLLAVSGTQVPAPRSLTAFNGRLYFAAGDLTHGRELWESDGTVAGTRPVHDIAPGAFSSDPQELVVAGGRLYFTANDGVHGREPWVYVPAGGACTPSAHALCLGGRFRVEADWRDFEGGSGRGTAVALTGDTGTFWFFDPSNVEVILKVLDGQGLNGHHWVFYGALSSVEYTLTVTDTQTGAVRRYINPSGRLGSVADTQAFGPQGAHLPGVVTTGPSPAEVEQGPRMGLRQAAAAGSCAPSSTRLCLNDGRFAVEARWKDFQGNTGTGKAVPLGGGETGYFWFFDEDNVEVVLKVLDGRPLNGKFWVFYGALSTVEYTLTVTDTVTGTVKTYTNPSGRLASVADTGAF